MDINIIINRLKEKKNFRTDAELVRFLDIRSSVLGNWRRRNTIDFELLMNKCKDEGWSLDWLFFGIENVLPSSETYADYMHLLQKSIADKDTQIAEKDRQLSEKDRQIKELHSIILAYSKK